MSENQARWKQFQQSGASYAPPAPAPPASSAAPSSEPTNGFVDNRKITISRNTLHVNQGMGYLEWVKILFVLGSGALNMYNAFAVLGFGVVGFFAGLGIVSSEALLFAIFYYQKSGRIMGPHMNGWANFVVKVELALIALGIGSKMMEVSATHYGVAFPPEIEVFYFSIIMPLSFVFSAFAIYRFFELDPLTQETAQRTFMHVDAEVMDMQSQYEHLVLQHTIARRARILDNSESRRAFKRKAKAIMSRKVRREIDVLALEAAKSEAAKHVGLLQSSGMTLRLGPTGGTSYRKVSVRDKGPYRSDEPYIVNGRSSGGRAGDDSPINAPFV